MADCVAELDDYSDCFIDSRAGNGCVLEAASHACLASSTLRVSYWASACSGLEVRADDQGGNATNTRRRLGRTLPASGADISLAPRRGET